MNTIHILAATGGGVLLSAFALYANHLARAIPPIKDPAAKSHAKRICESCHQTTSISFSFCEHCRMPHRLHWTEFDGMQARTLLDGSDLRA